MKLNRVSTDSQIHVLLVGLLAAAISGCMNQPPNMSSPIGQKKESEASLPPKPPSDKHESEKSMQPIVALESHDTTHSTSVINNVTADDRTPPSRREMLNELHASIRRCRQQKANEDVLKQVAAFRDAGFDVADGLKEIYLIERPVQRRMIIISELAKAGTPEAVTVLKDLALSPGDSAGTIGPRVVKALASITTDPDKITETLKSDSVETRNAAVDALRGMPLTDVAVIRLGELLKSNDGNTHNSVASAFATDRSDQTATRKVDLLVDSLKRLDDLQPQPNSPSYRTPRVAALIQYISALERMPGADSRLRERLAIAKPATMEHRVIALGMALRNTQSVHPLILEVIREETDPLLRGIAVRSLGIIGTSGDMEILKKVAETDPDTIAPNANHPTEIIYPNRIKAMEAIEAIKKRSDQ